MNINILVAALAIGLIVIIWYVRSRVNRPKSLYERLGGVYKIAALVDHFSDALIDNPIVGKNSPNPMLRDWHTNKLDRLPGLKFMRTLWLCALSGGPFKYSPTAPGKCPLGLENAHKDLRISPTEFDAVAQELANSLDYFSVPAAEKQEVLAAFAARKPEVDYGYQVANNLPITMAKCPFVL